MDQALDGETLSPTGMQVDGDEYVVEPQEGEPDDVAIINTDDDGGLAAPLPTADNYEAMKSVVLPRLVEDPEILADAVHTWHIENWTELSRKEHGPVFEAGGNPWRVLMFPSGNNVEHCSFYLEQGFEEGKVPDDWYCCAQFSLVLWNPNDPSLYTSHTAHHRFTKDEGDWGFTRFVELRKLFNVEWDSSGRPLVENEAANMTAYVRVVKDETGVLWHTFNNYDSKKETGYVGLKNQGATCYLNSLLQSLYFTNAFRKAVYQIPTEDEENLANSAYTLQRLFYQLQTSPTAVSTNELTKSFGWETRHIFEQQDVQELSRKLMERMEEKMKGTEAENVLPRLFCMKVKTYISCINVDYESSRVEDFWDIQLNVIGNKDIEESFKDYIGVEKMDGENQYFAGEVFKLQDANKGVIFQSFPEVLHLQLKRFEYDMERDATMKTNDRYEFPETFDASPYLAEDADKSEPYIYQLHSVLVHSGDLNAGHYYAFIKPTKDGCFYRCDDDKVIRATMREVLEDNFGGEVDYVNGQTKPAFQKPPVIRQNSAYMLVYIRRSRLDQVLLPVTKDDTPSHLQKKLDEENALREARRKEREEQHLYLNARVMTDRTFREHSSTDLTTFDASEKEPGCAKNFRVLRSSTVKDLAARVGADIGQDPRRIRFWFMVNRQNKTVRPDQPITDVNQTVEQAHQKLSGTKTQEIRLWAEEAEEVDSTGEPIWPGLSAQQTNGSLKSDSILLFLKWFDIDNQALKCIGHVYIGKERKVEDLVPLILQKMGWPEKLPSGDRTQLKLYEEIKPQMIDPMKGKQTLKAAELQDGDIICFQRVSGAKSEHDKEAKIDRNLASLSSSTDLSNNASRSPSNSVAPRASDFIEDAQLFYDYLLYRKIVHFLPYSKTAFDRQEDLDIELSSKYTYDQIAAKVGERINVDPTHLRFHTVNATTGAPKAPVKRSLNHTLQNILTPPYTTFGNNNQRVDELYFEVLEMSLSELDTKKSLRVIWLSEGITKDETFDILVPKSGNVTDLISGLIKKAKLDDEETAGPIRVYGIHNNKIYKEMNPEYSVASISEYITLVAERIPEEDVDVDPAHFIQAFHFQGEPNKPHGIPFKFSIRRDEKFSETRKRLEKRTGIKGKNFEKIKFAVVKRSSYSKPTYLEDDDLLWDVATNDDDLLGLDHIDRTRLARNGAVDLFLK
ncbi:hypothetical protein V490_03572 [Pseudogymnoascus sp. VKM F-3557]|nr:hypothetical protein V490_03572 [Pseudogymnoascus sp. VKM F-3557]